MMATLAINLDFFHSYTAEAYLELSQTSTM